MMWDRAARATMLIRALPRGHIMRTALRLAWCAIALALGGCANFKAVSSFAGQTTQLTGAVRFEFDQISKLCTEQAELNIVAIRADDSLLEGCKLQGDSLVAFQEVTIDTLDLYAQTLLAMVDNNNFDLRTPIESTGRKLAGLTTRDGTSIVNPAKVGAVTKVLALLADVVVQAKREEGIRRLVAAGPDLVANATIVREFFVSRGGPSAYDRWMTLVQVTSNATATQLAPETPLGRQEPIRTMELRRTIARAQPVIAKRRGDAPSTVPKQLVSALDAWIDAVPVFERDALRPDPEALLVRIDDLRKKALDARDAVRTSF
jgi:hypothetical protein